MPTRARVMKLDRCSVDDQLAVATSIFKPSNRNSVSFVKLPTKSGGKGRATKGCRHETSCSVGATRGDGRNRTLAKRACHERTRKRHVLVIDDRC
jgi:hypothetical protein